MLLTVVDTFLEGPICGWPDGGATCGANVGLHQTADPLTQTGLPLTSEVLGSFSQTIAQLAGDSRSNLDYLARQSKLQEMLDTFDYWDRSLNSMSQAGERWCKHTTRHLLQAIKTASLLRGGGRQLAEAFARSVAMVMPPAFQKFF